MYVFLIWYIGNIFLVNHNKKLLHKPRYLRIKSFKIKICLNALFVLDIHVYQDRSPGILELFQKLYEKI